MASARGVGMVVEMNSRGIPNETSRGLALAAYRGATVPECLRLKRETTPVWMYDCYFTLNESPLGVSQRWVFGVNPDV